MEFIRAAHNLTIELSPTTWRLFNGSLPSEPPESVIALLEAREGQIKCSPAFTKARRLPGEGQLEPSDVARIVVGWAPESRNWHLGLLLNADAGTGLKMRWCGLASWPSGPASEYVTQAKLAGQSLARIIDRPFRLVPPKGIVGTLQRTQPIQPTDRMEPSDITKAVTLLAPQAPPFEFEGWRMIAGAQGYLWIRPDKWITGAVVRAVGYALLAGVFIFLGVGTQRSNMAAVNPAWLPWAGVMVGVLLSLLALKQLAALLTSSDVLIDTAAREVRRRSRLLGRTRWQVPFDLVTQVLISQTPARAEGRAQPPKKSAEPESEAPQPPMRTTQDVWIHVYDGQQFWLVAALEHVQGYSHAWESVQAAQKTPGQRAFDPAEYDTPAHHAARLMASTLEAELWLDIV